jgi:hypothetical protein
MIFLVKFIFKADSSNILLADLKIYLAINLTWAENSDLAWMNAVLGKISKWFLSSGGISKVMRKAALALIK